MTDTNPIVFGCICINHREEVLLVHGRQSKKWSFPKGHMEKGEDGLTCAKREMLEETGITLVGNPLFSHKMKGGEYYFFSLEHDTLNIPEDSNHEIDQVAWFSLFSLPERDSNVDVSIVRKLMKSIRSYQGVFEFLGSPYVKGRIAMLLDNLSNQKSETQK